MRELVFGSAPEHVPQAMQPFVELMDRAGARREAEGDSYSETVSRQLGELGMPILRIIGGRDVLLDSQDTRDRLQRAVPHAEVCFIEEGYHFLPDLAPYVMEFLERSILPVASASER